jgi:hypothetical protein
MISFKFKKGGIHMTRIKRMIYEWSGSEMVPYSEED